MTRKDYIVIAEALLVARKTSATEEMVRGVDGAAEFIAVGLKRDNPRFDKNHFMAVIRGDKNLLSRPAAKARVQLELGAARAGKFPNASETVGNLGQQS